MAKKNIDQRDRAIATMSRKANLLRPPLKTADLKNTQTNEWREFQEVFGPIQKYYWDHQLGKGQVTTNIDRDVARMIFVSDAHIGHFASNHNLINEMVRRNGYFVGLGDLAEGFKPGGAQADTNNAATPVGPDMQMAALNDLLVEEIGIDNLLALVVGYMGHDQWARDSAATDPMRNLDKILREKMVRTGGQSRIRFSDGTKYGLLLFHAPGGGGSGQNPLDAQFDRLTSQPDCDAAASGHHHERSGIGLIVGDDWDGPRVRMAVSGGTFKGSTEGMTDRFLKHMAVDSYPPGANAVLVHTDKGEVKTFISGTWEKGDRLTAALEIWDLAEKNGLTDELYSLALDEHGRNRIKFVRGGRNGSLLYSGDEARVVKDGGKKIGKDRDLQRWNKAVYRVDSGKAESTPLPELIHFPNQFRAGSSTSREDLLMNVVKMAIEKGNVGLVPMRMMIDEGVYKREDRRAIVEKMVGMFGKLRGPLDTDDPATVDKLIGIFGWELDSQVLRNPGWMKAVSEDDTAFLAASYIQDTLGVPMIPNGRDLNFRYGADEYSMFMLDKLGHAGSWEKSFNGHRVRERRHLKKGGRPHQLIVGGHSPAGGLAEMHGFGLSYPQSYIQPGNYAEEWIGENMTNVQSGSVGGQAIELYFTPDGKIDSYLAPDLSHSEILHEGLTIHAAAEMAGGVQELLRRLGKNGKKTFRK